MKAPSFFIAEETPGGMTMEYRSKRRGFQFYVQGQVKEISKNFALEIKKLEIVLKKQEVIKLLALSSTMFLFSGCI
jgi:guanylate cyclase